MKCYLTATVSNTAVIAVWAPTVRPHSAHSAHSGRQRAHTLASEAVIGATRRSNSYNYANT